MKHPIFIGCDIGTSSTKAVAIDIKGNILAQSSKGYGIIQLHNNWAEQDPEVWLNAAVYCIQSVVHALPIDSNIASLCISALYGGTGVMCDETMTSIRPALIWMDRRAEVESEELLSSLGIKKIFDSSGNGIDSYFGYTKLLWVKKHEPDNWNRIKCILPIHSYIIYKMTGKITIDYSSAGNMGGIYDYKAHTWSKSMCQAMGIPYASLPSKFYQPSDVIGSLTEEYQQKLGLTNNTSVCAGTVDCIASMLSAGITDVGDNAAVLGTSLNWGYIHANSPKDANLVSMPYCINPSRISYTYGGSSTAGALPRWFANQFIGNDSSYTYSELEKKISEQNIGPGSDGLIILPYFMGERTPIWDENATGVFFGMTLAHTPAHIYRALMESVAYSLRHIMENMTNSNLSIKKIILVGGGARSTIWKQIFADVTGLPVVTPKQEIEAPLGDAFLAALGSGHIQDYQTIHSWISMNEPIYPNHIAHQKYNNCYSLYKELYPNLKELMSKRLDILK